MNLGEKLMAVMAEHDDDAPKMLPEAQVMELRDFLDRYTPICPFKRGDLVTPRENSAVKGSGNPHIVIQVLREPIEPQAFDIDDYTGNDIAQRQTMHVACFCGVRLTHFYADHNEFEPYTGPAA